MQSLLRIEDTYLIGMNDRYPAQLLDPGLLALASNCLVDNGRIEKRAGTNPVTSSLGSHAILGLIGFQPVGGTNYLVALLDGTSNAQLYTWAGTGNFSSLGSANITKGLQMNFVQAANYIYGVNGTDVVQISSNLTYTHNPSGVPAGTVLCWFHNYLFIANTTTNPSRIYWSNLGDPTSGYASASQYVDINPNDGDEITALAVFNDDLYVFKNNTIWSLSGFSGTSFTVTTTLSQNTNNLIYGYGTPAAKSIVNIGTDLYYLSFAGGIPHIRSFHETIYSTTLEQGVASFDIQNTMKGLQLSQLALAAGVYDGKYCYWSLPNGGSSYNNLVIVLEPTVNVRGKTMAHRSWVKWSGFNAAQFATSALVGENTIYFGDASATGNVNQMNYSAFADNGTAVTMTVQTKDYQYDLAKKAKYKYFYFDYEIGTAASLQIGAKLEDSVDFMLQQTLSFVGNSPGLGPTGTFTLGVSVLGGSALGTNRTTLQQIVAHHCQMQFLESTANQCKIQTLTMLGQLKGFRMD